MTALPLPASVLSAAALAAVNHVLDQADWARQRLQPFAGRIVRISMPPFVLSFALDSDGRFENSNAEPDLTIALPAQSPLLALQGNDQVMKAGQINGPADLADALSFVLRNLRWDIEEDLSKVFGDIVAHRIVATLNAFTQWQRQAARNFVENISEYLVEENPTLMKPADIAVFADEVGRLRNDLARIETRINHL